MVKIHVIAPSVQEAAATTGSLGSALGGAASVIEASGFFDSLGALGVEVEGISHPDPVDAAAITDPIERLGAFNAQVAEIASGAIARGAQPFLAGGTCGHLPGMVGGLEQAYGPTAKIGLIWMDAHGDFNSPKTSYSQMLGGMPVAVVAGLCYPVWREKAGISAPMPTDRIVMIDVRNLDDREETLIRATDVTVARFGEGFDPSEIVAAIDALAAKVDYLYLHIDSDILDERFQPNHPTREPNGPDDTMVDALIEHIMATGKVVALAVVSINPEEPGGAVSLASGQQMMRTGLTSWAAAGANV